MWKHIMAANQTIWVAPVDAHSKSLCSDETAWNQASDWVSDVQIATVVAWIHHLPQIERANTLNIRAHPPSWTGHKGKDCMFLMHKLPLDSRPVTPAKIESFLSQ